MPRRPGEPFSDPEAMMLEVVHRHYLEHQRQTAIGKELGIPQGTVSRILKRAEELGIVRHRPPEIRLPDNKRLGKKLLQAYQERGLREVVVVPNGMGRNAKKNVNQIGAAGAHYLAKCLAGIEKATPTIGMACGSTLSRTVTRFSELLKENTGGSLDTLRAKETTIYPLNLYREDVIDYDTTLFPTVLAFELTTLLKNLECRVRTVAPQIPLSFYKSSRVNPKMADHCSEYLRKTKMADIFLLGVGPGVRDRNYKRVLRSLTKTPKDLAGELNYHPFDRRGNFAAFSKSKPLGISGDEFSSLARGKKRVVALAGGTGKTRALKALFNRSALPFNVLITDSSLASELLAGASK